ncbi:MAG: C39 family peptidase [Eggerthellaceae bacterium]|nr:C39 family peptidase [Eggerthellaceae bacterium]
MRAREGAGRTTRSGHTQENRPHRQAQRSRGQSNTVVISPTAQLVIAGIILLVIVILIVSGIRSCSQSDQSPEASGSGTSTEQASDEGNTQDMPEDEQSEGNLTSFNPYIGLMPLFSELSREGIDHDYIAIIIGAEYADMLIEEAQTSSEALWIASNPDEYLEDGPTVRYKLLKLAAKEPEAVSFVREWPDKYCADEPDYTESHTDESSNGVPRFYQWDKRWGYTEYSSTTFALTGCGPTTMAMVYQAIKGDTSMDPYAMGVWCIDNGYATAYDGTDSAFFTDGANELGLNSQRIGTDAYSITEALSSGKLVIANVGPGDFTEGGHYFVITGINADGTVTINDPYSAVRSAKSWDPELIAEQSKALFAIS